MFNTFLSYVGAGPLSPRNRPSLGPRDAGDPNRSRSASPPYIRMDYSLEGFQNVVEDLIGIAGDAENPIHTITAPAEQLVEVIRRIAETLLWGEQNEEDSLMFDYFCEKGVMKIFVSLLNSPTVIASGAMFSRGGNVGGGRQIKVQLLQTMSLLVLNIKRQTSLYFLFSNNAINMLINNNSNLDFSDEEILSYYVSFMKSISLRLSPETIKLFINEKQNYFPLFVQSIRFFDHHDRMIRNAVRTITLSVFKLMQDSESLLRIVQENAGGYFSLLACQLRDVWFLIDKSASLGSPHNMSILIEELIDQLEYVADINRLGYSELNGLLFEKMQIYAIDQVLLPSLTMADSSSLPPTLSNSTALFVLSRLVHVWPQDSEKVLLHFLATSSSLRKFLKNITPEFIHLVLLFVILEEATSMEETKEHSNVELLGQKISKNLVLKQAVAEFGLFPPGSIDLSLLVCQSIAKSLDRCSQTTIRVVAHYLKRVLVRWNTCEEFIRPLRLTIQDSFKHVCQKILSILDDSQNRAQPDSLDYSVIDIFETCLLSTNVFPTSVEIEKLATNPWLLLQDVSAAPPEWKICKGELSLMLTLFLELMLCVTHILDDRCLDFRKVASELFTSDEPGLEAGSIVDLGAQPRIACTDGGATRYFLMDPCGLILVAPDLTQPGFGIVKFFMPLRKISNIAKPDPKSLNLIMADSSVVRLAFEDLKRCQLALVHLETKRVELRRSIFHRIQAYIKQF